MLHRFMKLSILSCSVPSPEVTNQGCFVGTTGVESIGNRNPSLEMTSLQEVFVKDVFFTSVTVRSLTCRAVISNRTLLDSVLWTLVSGVYENLWAQLGTPALDTRFWAQTLQKVQMSCWPRMPFEVRSWKLSSITPLYNIVYHCIPLYRFV